MDTTPPSPAPPGRVPDELMQKLHDANGKFHELRERLEVTKDAPTFRHEQRVDTAADHLRQAEREVEEVEAQIKKFLSGQ